MNGLKLFQSLTNRDLDILTVLWNSSKSMTASEITSANPDLKINTVQAVLRKLLKNNVIEVSDIVYSGTVLSRSYAPKISRKDFALFKLTSEYHNLGKDLSKASLVASLLDTESDEEKVQNDIIQLKEMLDHYKKNISKES